MTDETMDGDVANGDAMVDAETRKLLLRLFSASRTLTKSQLAAAFHATYRNWDQLCQATVRQACAWTGGAPTPNYLSAKDAYEASSIHSLNPDRAPIDAVHYWDIGRYWHVAGGLGGEAVFMGSRHVATSWGINVGQTTVGAYGRVTGAKYMGWSLSNGHNVLRLAADAAPRPKPASKQKFTLARPGEGLLAIAVRCNVSLGKVEQLNPQVDPPAYVVKVGQKIRYA